MTKATSRLGRAGTPAPAPLIHRDQSKLEAADPSSSIHCAEGKARGGTCSSIPDSFSVAPSSSLCATRHASRERREEVRTREHERAERGD